MRAQTRQAQTQVNGCGRVGPGTNTLSSHGRKANRAQLLQWGHVSGRGRMRHRTWARTGTCYRGGRAHSASGAGSINKSSPYFIFANLSSRSAPCPSMPSALCKELWCGRLALKLVEGGLCPLLFVRCLLVVECIQTTMSKGSGRSGGRRPNRGVGRSRGKRQMYEDLDAPQSTDWLTLSDSGTGSSSGGPSLS
jgi:hypothetical protein